MLYLYTLHYTGGSLQCLKYLSALQRRQSPSISTPSPEGEDAFTALVLSEEYFLARLDPMKLLSGKDDGTFLFEGLAYLLEGCSLKVNRQNGRPHPLDS